VKVSAGILLLFFATFSASAQNIDAKFNEDLLKLQAAYKSEVEKTLAPITQRYIQGLETLGKRATFNNDLETAINVRKELDRVKATVESPLIGQWEYKQSGNVYRRIIRKYGIVELWKNGKLWLKSDGTPWWPGFRWQPEGKTIKILNSEGEQYLTWSLVDKDTVLQKDIASGKTIKLTRGSGVWK
jgi:hypothetical protein